MCIFKTIGTWLTDGYSTNYLSELLVYCFFVFQSVLNQSRLSEWEQIAASAAGIGFHHPWESYRTFNFILTQMDSKCLFENCFFLMNYHYLLIKRLSLLLLIYFSCCNMISFAAWLSLWFNPNLFCWFRSDVQIPPSGWIMSKLSESAQLSAKRKQIIALESNF